MVNEDGDDIEELEKMAREFTCDPARYENYKRVFTNIRQKILKLDDTFPFDGTKCVTDCGGKCCYDNDPQINTYDVYKIVTSKLGVKLGYANTTKLFNGASAPLGYALGRSFGHPQAWIRFVSIGGGMTVCPFLRVAKPARSKHELVKLHKIHKEKLPTIYTRDGTPRGLCTLHEIKPTVCRSFPIGRVGRARGGFFYVFHPPSERCACVETEKRVKVRDYIREWSLDEYYAENDKYYKVLAEFSPPLKGLRLLLLVVLFNFDLPAVRAGLDPVKVRPTYDMIITTADQLIKNWGEDLGEVRGALRRINWDLERDSATYRLVRDSWPGGA